MLKWFIGTQYVSLVVFLSFRTLEKAQDVKKLQKKPSIHSVHHVPVTSSFL